MAKIEKFFNENKFSAEKLKNDLLHEINKVHKLNGENEKTPKTAERILQKIIPLTNLKKIKEAYLQQLPEWERGKVAEKQALAAIAAKYTEKIAKELGFSLGKCNGDFYIYNTLFWEKININFFCDSIFQRVFSNFPAVLPKKYTSEFEYILKTFYFNEIEINNVHGLNLKNCAVLFSEKTFFVEKHSPKHGFTYILPYNYDEEAKAPMWEGFLNDVLPDKALQATLQQFAGYVFTKNLKLEKCLVLHGAGANGKSVVNDVFSAMYGSENVTHFTLDNVCDDKGYSRAKINNKLVNYSSEIAVNKLNTDIFKKLVSGEPTEAREPYKMPFVITPPKFIFNANELPKNVEISEGFFRRLLIIPFTVKIAPEKQNPHLSSEIIKKELPGVLNWALQGFLHVVTNNAIEVPPASVAAVEEYKKAVDSVASFVDDEDFLPANGEEGDFISTENFFSQYKEYCFTCNFKPVGIKTFVQRLEYQGFIKHRTKEARGFFIKKRGE